MAGSRFQPWVCLQVLRERGPALPHWVEGPLRARTRRGRGRVWLRSKAWAGVSGWGFRVSVTLILAQVVISGLFA
ncbi:unnamed protein product [Gulo gulo]|uniref:Uncharacterized protein n=1 Tax=Gulo gulo TaxID=48420 RepID=A0A9X9LD79_GULGU|nr:unnamed protein product [Gulo gulo]